MVFVGYNEAIVVLCDGCHSGKEVIIICLQIEIIFVRIDRILGKLSYVGESFLSVVGKGNPLMDRFRG